MILQIKSRFTDAVLYSGEGKTLGEVVVAAVSSGANLRGANLGGANLGDANLGYADLRGAHLGGANLGGANLGYADLRGANLGGADLGYARLRGARLRGADLGYADLRGAHLGYADLRGANLGGANLGDANLGYANLLAPAVMLALGFWGELSNDLTADLMLWDAANHPNPEMFDAWAKGGPCPYGDGRVQRACHFYEQRHLWGKGQVCRPWDLWERLRAEKCPDWSDEEVAAFEAKFKKE